MPFINNFLNYSPSIAIINNVEMDHPEFFKDINEVKNSFKNFIKKLIGPKILIINEDSTAIREILGELKDWLNEEGVKVIGYYVDNKLDFPFDMEYRVELISNTPEYSSFKVVNGDKENNFNLGLIGKHNVENSLGVLITALELGVDIDAIKLSYPGKKIFAVFEPHQLSRAKLFFNEFAAALKKADRVIITKPFLGREANKNIEPVNFDMLCTEIDINKAEYIESPDEVCSKILSEVKSGDIVIVFGAGEAYKLSREIINTLNEKAMLK